MLMRRTLVNLGFLAPLALWTGAAAGLTFLTTPVVFRQLDRDSAARLVGAIFPGYFQAGIVCVTLSLIAAIIGVRGVPGPKRRLWAIPGVLAAALLIMLYGGLVLEPKIAAVQAQIPSFVTDTSSPARQEFRRLHGLSSILNLAGMLLVAAAWVLTAIDPRHLTGGQSAQIAAPSEPAASERPVSGGQWAVGSDQGLGARD
jgi:hypothetical protein